ncbi:hypothetical protein LTR86_006124 [Recurvomyces mirabilis]|nr:hypothetical protein LTR86_006124 [Recurvomyces mirabilis]
MGLAMGRLLLLPGAILALSVQHTLASPLEARETTNNSLVAPIDFAPDGTWDGIDGSWSTFAIGIGTPLQYIRTFVSLAAYQTLAVLPVGCQSATSYSACADNRGGIYNETASSSFQSIGIYDWMIESNLGIEGNSQYGYDTVALGNGSSGPTLKNTTVGGYAVADFYLGIFGVNPKPTNFTTFDNGSPSYISQLKEQNLISSISASYTAGALYRSNKVPGTLTLGGYDSSKFVPNDVEFIFSGDNTRDIVVGVQSISTPSQNSSDPVAVEMLPGPIFAFVDSTVPQIWLPIDACKIFEYEFGLTYDNKTELYLVNDTIHSSLVQRNASITFGLAQSTTGGEVVQITLPYAAFDLEASPPYQGLANQTRYFPLRRAANDSQYTLGRTFFQEAYVTIDWEAQRFNVSQVQWTQNAQPQLIAIAPGSKSAKTTYPGTGTSSSSQSKGLAAGAIAGIVVGVIAGLIVLALFLFWLIRKRRQSAKAKAEAAAAEKLDEDGSVVTSGRGSQPTVFPKAELEGSAPIPPGQRDSDNRRLLSAHGSDPDTPGTMGAPSSAGYFRDHRGSSAYSPSTPVAGEGTHSSTQSESNGTHSSSILFSPLSPSNASEADSKERQVYEMAGDMPTIKEKDGKALSEKEAMQRREREYNGVDTSPVSAPEQDEQPARERRLINPEEVVQADNSRLALPDNFTRHRAFSFEEQRGDLGKVTGTEDSDELYSAR